MLFAAHFPPINVGMQKMCDERKRRNLNLHFPTFFILHTDQNKDKKKDLRFLSKSFQTVDAGDKAFYFIAA